MQRNGQNPTRAAKSYDHLNKASVLGSISNSGTGSHTCLKCQTEVPFKPGFRLSSIKCPKCGTQIGKK